MSPTEETRLRLYTGTRDPQPHVTIEGQPLRFPDLGVSFRPWEFDWGNDSPGAAALALAILAEHLGDVFKAQQLCPEFLSLVVARLPVQEWRLTSDQIRAALPSENVPT